MKILITGALGHIGSYLIRRLPELGPVSEIQMLDNMSVQRYCSLFNLPESTTYHFREGDVRSPGFLESMGNKFDAVIHLAAVTNAAESFEFKDQLEKNNFGATQAVASFCVANKIPLLFASTTSVYGTASEVVYEDCPESDLKPQSPYAETKLKEEKLLINLAKKSGLKFVICRFGTIFGTSPGMRFHTAVNKFCWQAAMQTPITVWKTALHQKRPYLDLADAARAIEHILKNKLFTNSIYNVLTINATVNDILSEIRKGYSDLKIEFVDAKIMNQLSYEVSSKKFEETGFKSSGSLSAQIAATLKLLQQAHRHS